MRESIGDFYLKSKTENTGVVEMRVFKRKSGGTIDEAESQNKKAGDQI